ncbi:unnamed protein product, partial [Effrenium voratum]
MARHAGWKKEARRYRDGHENPQAGAQVGLLAVAAMGAMAHGEEEKIRVAPGQALKPASTDIFQRLHASHA